MSQKDEMTDLLDRVVIDLHSMYITPKTQDARNILADWITDHPMMAGELLAELLRKLPVVLATLMKEHLIVEAHPKTTYAGSRSITTGIRVTLSWGTEPIAHAEVDI